MELWNQQDLVPPVLATFPCRTKNTKEEIRTLITAVNSTLQFFESQRGFNKAAAYASRFTTRWKNRFYNMHGFRLFRRLNQSLLRFRNLDIVCTLTNLASLLPDGGFLTQTVDLPTRAYLDYVLVRLQGTAKLFCRIVTLAEEACKYYVRFMSTGYFFNLSSMFLCLLSEVWYKSRDICQRTVEFYNKLFLQRPLLEVAHAQWPTGGSVALPPLLCEWLGDDWTSKIIPQDSQMGEFSLRPDTDLFLLLTGEEVDLSSATKIDSQIVAKAAAIETKSRTSVPGKALMERVKSDVGEVVVRKQEVPRTTKNKDHDALKALEAIKSKFDARALLDEEKRKRRENSKLALSRNVAAPAFNAFATSMLREINKLSTGDFVRVFKAELTQLLGIRGGGSEKKKKRK